MVTIAPTADHVEVQPFILQKPLLHIEDETGAVYADIQCSANQVEAVPDQDESTTETFCGSYTSYKAEVWTVTITALQSYGPDGLWTKLRPLANKRVYFTIRPDVDKPKGMDNPEMSGWAILKAFAFLSAAVGEASDFDVVLGVQGLPTWDPAPGGTVVTATGATAGTPGSFTPTGATAPYDLGDLQAGSIVASPSTAWTTGQSVVLGDG